MSARWQPHEPLPGNYEWGYASRSRARAMVGPVVEHVIVEAASATPGVAGYLLCSGGWGLVGNGGGELCPSCVAQVRAQLADDGAS